MILKCNFKRKFNFGDFKISKLFCFILASSQCMYCSLRNYDPVRLENGSEFVCCMYMAMIPLSNTENSSGKDKRAVYLK